MSKMEDVDIDEVGELKEVSGGRFKQGLKILGKWYSIFGKQEEMQQIQDVAKERMNIDFLDTSTNESGGKTYHNIDEIKMGQLEFKATKPTGKPRQKASGGGSSSGGAQAAPAEQYADVTVIAGRTINKGDYNSEKIQYGVTVHGVPLDKIDEVQVRETKRVGLWVDHAESRER